MNLIKEFSGVLKFSLESNLWLFLLQEENGVRAIRKLSSTDFSELWSHANDYYSYQILGDKIYLTTTGKEQRTEVLNLGNGNALSEHFEATFHFDGYFKTRDEFLCIATLDKKKVYVLFDVKSEKILDVFTPPLGINNVYKLAGRDNYLSVKKGQINLYKAFESDPVWEFYIDRHLGVPVKVGHKQIDNTDNTIIVKIDDLSRNERYLVGLDLQTGKVKWRHQGYSNFELHNGKLYNIEFYGQYRVLNAESGEIEQEADLQKEFERVDINCEHRFNVSNSHIYFKHAIKGKFGVLNTKTLKIEEVQQLPEGNTMSTEEYPIPVDNRLYVRSAPQNNLFVYER
ncbi:hypothetical protein AB9P05_21655 [Roseivirga sp. BDSF3-8]|uniref:hypothetical protein n=1 Tax=Roseivirga sp. BDSF3-8 TaxID=3241598 RepID=UPI0035325AEB